MRRHAGDQLAVAPSRGAGLEVPAELVSGAGRGGLHRYQGAILQASAPPSPERRVVGRDVLARLSSPRRERAGQTGRAPFAPDDGRRGSVGGVGACEPATGLVTTRCSPRLGSPGPRGSCGGFRQRPAGRT